MVEWEFKREIERLKTDVARHEETIQNLIDRFSELWGAAKEKPPTPVKESRASHRDSPRPWCDCSLCS